MKIVIDIEANGLENPTQIWLIVCKDIDTGERHIFRNVTLDIIERDKFLSFANGVTRWIGHNLLGYDYPVLNRLINLNIVDIGVRCCDTLVVSKLLDYSRSSGMGHSIEDYGVEFGQEKISFKDFSQWSPALETYCIRDVDITERIYNKYKRHIHHPDWQKAFELEHKFQLIVNSLHDNGFSFNKKKAEELLTKVEGELLVLDEAILREFPPRLKLLREIHPKETKHGTLSRTDFRWVKDGDLSEFNGGPFSRCNWVPFNPSSHSQIIGVLAEAGWSPVDKTQTHIDALRELNSLKRSRGRDNELPYQEKLGRIQILEEKLAGLEKTGWRVNEVNLNTLPSTAPSPAKTLANRILLEARRRTLTEWLGLHNPDTGRIHGKFYGIGAWTHRMAHQHPNTANIPTDRKLYGSVMRSLWQAPRNRLLVGVDAEGIQLRIFAHYIDDKEFTDSLVNGKKEDKSDPHSLNQRILGAKSRDIAKRFIFAYLLGGGVGKLSQILEVDEVAGKLSLARLLDRYSGLSRLKDTVIPVDARRGYFQGIDGRLVKLPGETPGERKHLCMSGYLQNGEAVVMKLACLKWHEQMKDIPDWKFVNFVHDEWQTECKNSLDTALRIAKIQAESLRLVGEELGLKCPLAGSYWNDDRKDYTIGLNWKVTH